MIYAEWIAAYVARMNGHLLGRCLSATREMKLRFPELTIVCGHVEVPHWGRRGHWWLTAPDGAIVDPTAFQFPAILEYIPWTPVELVHVGKCMECGEKIWRRVETLDGIPKHETFCGSACEREYISHVEHL